MSRPGKKTLSVRLPEELMNELDDWIEAQRIRPTRTAIIEGLLRDFLRKEKKAK